MNAITDLAVYDGRRAIGHLRPTLTGYRAFGVDGREIEGGERTLLKNALRAVAEADRPKAKPLTIH